ncbi:unnamed protein product [Ectocarpus sp. CCAP 1310/34]|nr:unnamed protein product [Ectocarpus sp. CCAP 1310/34]
MSSAAAGGSRALHWVLKIGSLKKSMTFFENVLGLKVLRHEEFDEGCEATCNGPYGGAWSKTMIGYGPEEESFALELTYNYGIDGYKNGDDLQYICLQLDVEATKAKAEAEGYACAAASGGGVLISGPDGYKYKAIPSIEGRKERFVSVGLKVSDLTASTAYWCGVLGMSKFSAPAPASEPGDGVGLLSETVGYGEEQVKLDLLQAPGAEKTPIDHGLASGRIAFACDLVPPIHSEAAAAASGTVITPPLTLPTPGKADVVVTILGDPDGYEICFVEAVAFYQLAEPKYDVIDFESRATRGGDGAAPPKSEKLQHAAGVTAAVTTPEEVAEAVAAASGDGVVLLDFGAGWCKNCKKMVPAIEKLATGPLGEKLKVLTVDIDEADELADEYDVSGVPTFVALRGGSGDKADEYKGNDPAALEAKISALLG